MKNKIVDYKWYKIELSPKTNNGWLDTFIINWYVGIAPYTITTIWIEIKTWVDFDTYTEKEYEQMVAEYERSL